MVNCTKTLNVHILFAGVKVMSFFLISAVAPTEKNPQYA